MDGNEDPEVTTIVGRTVQGLGFKELLNGEVKTSIT